MGGYSRGHSRSGAFRSGGIAERTRRQLGVAIAQCLGTSYSSVNDVQAKFAESCVAGRVRCSLPLNFSAGCWRQESVAFEGITRPSASRWGSRSWTCVQQVAALRAYDGILGCVKLPGTGSKLDGRRSRRWFARMPRNGRLIVQAALQHLGDDPILLVLQVSRRLPVGARVATGNFLQRVSGALPEVGALGAVLAGRRDAAVDVLSRQPSPSGRWRARVAGEVAILVGRQDLIPEDSPATVLARAAWARGDLTGAVGILRDGGEESGRYARRLRSEFALLQPGHRLLHGDERRHLAGSAPSTEATEQFRILHVLTNSLPHTQSGYSLRSHRILTALQGQGMEVVAQTRTGYPVMLGKPFAEPEDVVDGIRYVRTLPITLPQTQEERLNAEVDNALRLVAEFRPNVLHTTTNYLNALVTRRVSEVTGIPWVFEVRGLMEQTWVASHHEDSARAMAAASEKHDLIAARETELAHDADAVVTLSRTMADELARRGLDPAGIRLVPNGVDDGLFSDHVSTTKARRLTGLTDRDGFGAEAILVGAVSALVDYEGYDVLLDAVAALLHDSTGPQELRERLRVVIAGDGVSRPDLLQKAEMLGISDRVLLPGRVPRAEARRWVESLDIVAVPRRDVAVARAVTPQKPIEAMALQRPVIASDLPALREAVGSCDDGPPTAVLVPPENPRALAAAIVRLWSDTELRTAMVESSLAVARERAWGRQVRRYSEIYRSVTRAREGGYAIGTND